jgi:hypothetical protein
MQNIANETNSVLVEGIGKSGISCLCKGNKYGDRPGRNGEAPHYGSKLPEQTGIPIDEDFIIDSQSKVFGAYTA